MGTSRKICKTLSRRRKYKLIRWFWKMTALISGHPHILTKSSSDSILKCNVCCERSMEFWICEPCCYQVCGTCQPFLFIHEHMMHREDNKWTCSVCSRSGQSYLCAPCKYVLCSVCFARNNFNRLPKFDTLDQLHQSLLEHVEDTLLYIPVDLRSIIIDFALPQKKIFYRVQDVSVLSSKHRKSWPVVIFFCPVRGMQLGTSLNLPFPKCSKHLTTVA